jgi:cobalt/nickel transport system ATP-binding protein
LGHAFDDYLATFHQVFHASRPGLQCHVRTRVAILTAIHVSALSFTYPDGTTALRDDSFRADEGGRVGLIGTNGSGKSTLLHHLNGLLPNRLISPSSVRIFDIPVTAETVYRIRSQVGLLFQDPDDQLFCSTVGEDVGFGPAQFGLPKDRLSAVVKRALEQVGLQGYEHRAPHRLSRGEKRRVCLAGVLACDAKLLALDEPTSDLDPRSRRELIEILKGLPIPHIIASHDLDFVERVCNRVILLNRGSIAALGTTHEILSNEKLLFENGL